MKTVDFSETIAASDLKVSRSRHLIEFMNGPGHMTKMAAMPIYGKNPSKIFSGTGGPISIKLGM